MGVYSVLSKEELNYIEQLYNLKIENIKYIDKGILNSNFILKTCTANYILRVFEADRSFEEEEQELKLLENIADIVPVALAVRNKNGSFITKYNSKKMALFNYIDGEALQFQKINQSILRELAWYLGKFHRYSESKSIRVSDFSRKSRINLEIYLEKIENENLEFEGRAEILNLAKKIKKIDFLNLPMGIIHSDIFPDNIILKNGQIHAILDFNEAQYAPFIFDIAIVINFWIKINRYEFQKENEMIRDFLNNYSRYRKIKKEELVLLDFACKKIALTFILLRIYKEKSETGNSFSSAVEIENKNYLEILDLIN